MLAEGYRTNLTGLTQDEARALFMPGMAQPLADLGAGKAIEAALLKLLATLPSSRRREVEHTRQRLYLDAVGWYHSNEPTPFLQTLREATWSDHRLRIVYRKSNGEVSERIVEPLGLVAKAGVWYMVALSKGDMRVFRVSRVRDAEIVDEVFQRPEQFDLEQYWSTWSQDFETLLPPYPVTLRIAPTFVPTVPLLLGEEVHTFLERAGPPDSEGWLTLTIPFSSFESACRNILGFGTQVEVLEPQELRQLIIQVATGIIAFYREREPYL